MIASFLLILSKNNVLKIFGLILLLIIIYFFRNTGLKIDSSENILVSPSSSKITRIEKLPDKITFIETYLSPFNEHYFISPCECTVKQIISNPRESDAERMQVTLVDKENNIIKIEAAVSKIGQGSWIPNLLVNKRVIVSVKEGDVLPKGKRLGMVRFGSEMAYYIPNNYKIIGKEGDFFKIGSKFAEKIN